MKLGNKVILILILFFSPIDILITEEKITSTPLINVEQITPSFEELQEENWELRQEKWKLEENNELQEENNELQEEKLKANLWAMNYLKYQ